VNHHIDASDIGFTAGDFHWGDGRSVSRLWFHPDESMEYDDSKSTCVFLFKGQLDDMNCSKERPFICKVGKKYIDC
jgi:hypothetical protein